MGFVGSLHQKGWSQGELAAKSGVSRELIGKYERGEAVSSVNAAKKIADAFEVSLDYLAGSTSQLLEKNLLKRINDIRQLPPKIKPICSPSWTLSSETIKLGKFSSSNA